MQKKNRSLMITNTVIVWIENNWLFTLSGGRCVLTTVFIFSMKKEYKKGNYRCNNKNTKTKIRPSPCPELD